MQLLEQIRTQSKGTLTLERIENIGGHYSKTLRLWRKNFLLNFDSKIKPALLKSHPEMSDESVRVFRRKWDVSRANMFLQKHKRNSHTDL